MVDVGVGIVVLVGVWVGGTGTTAIGVPLPVAVAVVPPVSEAVGLVPVATLTFARMWKRGELEVAPSGLTTMTLASPIELRFAAGTTAVSWVADENVVASDAPFHFTI